MATEELTVSNERAAEVLAKISAIKDGITETAFELGDLLSEVRKNEYHSVWGFPSFGEWLGQSGLDMSERTAYYLVKIVDTSKALGISRDQLKAVKMSKLKAIFTLDANEHAEEIKALVAQGETKTL